MYLHLLSIHIGMKYFDYSDNFNSMCNKKHEVQCLDYSLQPDIVLHALYLQKCNSHAHSVLL